MSKILCVADRDDGQVGGLQILLGDAEYVGLGDVGDGLLEAKNEVTRVAVVIVGDKAVERLGRRIEIEDEGAGYNPADVPDPTTDENLEKPSGRGLMLMRAFVTSVTVVGRGNLVILEKTWGG